jgi:hypothetical protein
MTAFQYVVVKYVPNVLRDESVNVGVIVRDVHNQDFGYRFLSRGAVVKKLWPNADTQIVRHLEHELGKTRQAQLSLDEAPALGRAGPPTSPDFFAKARHEFTGNLQMTLERGIAANSLDEALAWAYSTFVAEPAIAARPINYQALAPLQTRERLWRAFERKQLIGKRRVQRRAVLQGRHAPWTFDLAYKNGALNLINSLALKAGPEANLGRALVFKGMLEEVESNVSDQVRGIAVVQWPKPEQRDDSAAPKAVAILEDAGIDTYDVVRVDELADRVQQDLSSVATR